MIVLWLDDQRDPYQYLNVEKKSKTYLRNKQFYDNLMLKNNLVFVWVKNFYQFVQYIKKNGVPQFVSFDHDLNNRKGGEGVSDFEKTVNNGLNCAKWLIDYCEKTKSALPKFYVHSANPKYGPQIVNLLNAASNEGKVMLRMTEGELVKIIKESVKIILESHDIIY